MIVVSRWTRFGKDRLYVMDGPTRLGWFDLDVKELHLRDDTRADIEALRSHPQSRDHLAGSLETSSEAREPREDPAPQRPATSTPERKPARALDPRPGARVWISANQMRINDQVVPYLRNSRHRASRATKLLSATLGWIPPVRPAIVLHLGLLADPITVKASPADVDVVDSLRVPRVFSKRPAILSAEQIDQIHAAARDPRTWTRQP